MTPTHAVKKGVRYRYYVSRRLVTGRKGDDGNGQMSGQRIPAANLEGLVVQRLRSFFADPVAVIEFSAATTLRRAVAEAGDRGDNGNR